MKHNIIKLEGVVKEYVKSQSSNPAFMIEDKSNNLHYCYTTKKNPNLTISDQVIIIGNQLVRNKIKIVYILNKSKNTEIEYIGKKSYNLYYIGLIISIIFIALLIISIILISISFRGIFNPLDYMSIFMFVFSLIFLIVTPIGLIIVLPITFLTYKSRKNESEIQIEINRLKEAIVNSIGKKELTTLTSENGNDKKISPKFCSLCGERLPDEASYCPVCGNKL